MNIKNHGVWQRYTPKTLPKDAPPNALFARRVKDGKDWYDYVNSGENFAKDSVKITVLNNVVAAAVIDATSLFPADTMVLEVTDIVTSNPQDVFGRKIYDANNQSFHDVPPFELPDTQEKETKIMSALEEIMKRLDKLEAK